MSQCRSTLTSWVRKQLQPLHDGAAAFSVTVTVLVLSLLTVPPPPALYNPEMLCPLTRGACLVVPTQDGHMDPGGAVGLCLRLQASATFPG